MATFVDYPLLVSPRVLPLKRSHLIMENLHLWGGSVAGIELASLGSRLLTIQLQHDSAELKTMSQRYLFSDPV